MRGAFTVFSLGLDELGTKLRKQGLDVEVTTASGSSSAAAKIRNAYRADPSAGPIVIIGHSLGGKLAPQLARDMKRYGVPVKLVLILDAPESMSIPSNVERCVNIYQSIPTGVVRGLPARAESRSTEMVNIDIARYRGLSVNHFNIDGSDWIHDAVVKEVVRNCLPADPATSPMEIAATPEKQPATTSKRQSAKTPKKQIADAPGETIADAPGDETGTSLTVPWPAFDVERRSIVSRIVK
ncbi:MAG: thioesterase domain-containing protein [Planctomycetota bacterium]